MNLVLLAEDQPFFKALDPISEGIKFLGEFNIWTILIRVFLALLIGLVFGLERSRKRHTAGLRTFTFVSLFASSAALLDVYFMSNFTAVALWLIGIVGACFGAGLYTVALLSAVLAYICLNVMPKLEIYLKNRSNHFEIHLELKNRNDLVNFTGVVRKLGIRIDDIEANPAYNNTGLGVYTISLTIKSGELKKYKTHEQIIEALKTLDYINCIEEIN